MPRHFNGFVSRFSAGGRDASPGDRQAATALLQRSGISPLGIRQVLDAEIVANPGDRQKLAGIVAGLLPAVQSIGHAAPLLSAVQSVRDTQRLREFGLSAAGAQQFASGLPVSGASDRQTLAQVVAAAAGGASSVHLGGGNQLQLDDTAGKEK